MEKRERMECPGVSLVGWMDDGKPKHKEIALL